MADTKSRAMWLADIADDNSPTTADCEAIAAELRRLDAVEAERDHLRECLESNFRSGNEWRGEAGALAAERDALRAEVERLRVDAERWQWLRSEHERHDPICHLSWKRNGDRSSNEWVNTSRLDASADLAIDAARGAA